jgi:peptidoglycan/LPS O-acetylase OafA/YrhL
LSSPTLSAKRLYSIDALRGVAALGVVLWHWQHFYAISGSWAAGWSRSDQPFYLFLKPLYDQGWMAVDLFFAVSGFVFFWLYLEPVAKREVSAGKFALQRFSRLYPIYCLMLFVAAALQLLFHRATGNYFIFTADDARHFVASLFLVQQWLPPDETQSFNGPAWAVSIEVLLYLIFFAGACLKLRGPLYAAIMVLAGSLEFPHDGQISRGIMDFFMGGLVFYATAHIASRPRAKSLSVAVATAAVVAWIVAVVEVYLGPIQALFLAGPAPLAHFFATNAYQIYLFSFILVVSPLTLLALALHEELFGGPYARLAFLGDISYSTYMVHFPMQLTLALLALHFGWKPADFMNGVVLVLFYCAMIALGALSYNYFERPVQTIIRGIAKKSASSPAR